MMTLRDLFDAAWDITELDITAREPEGMKFIHRWKYGDHTTETLHMYHERQAGRLSIVEGRINHHGEASRGGAEMGWGVKTKLFPAEILDAPVLHLSMYPLSQGRGTHCMVDVEMQKVTALTHALDQREAEEEE